MIQQLIFDISDHHHEADLVALFLLLPNVRILSITRHAKVQQSGQAFPYFSHTLTLAMAQAFGSSLRMLALYRYALVALLLKHAWLAFMVELIQLEAFVSACLRFQAPWVLDLAPLPESTLPLLKYMHLNDTSVQVPIRAWPMHLHCPLPSVKNDRLRNASNSLLSRDTGSGSEEGGIREQRENSTLHSNLSINPQGDPIASWLASSVFATLHTIAPNLTSLTLTSAPGTFIILLALCTFPPTVSHLCFASIPTVFNIATTMMPPSIQT
ncbi:hypothetical protein OF83DRAFT_1171374 [Amylostereum chailletii]|nr:hypothetical protein OF83DRAFT_1171374 [Amylostereum chailletii]